MLLDLSKVLQSVSAERLNIQITKGQTVNKHRILTHNLQQQVQETKPL